MKYTDMTLEQLRLAFEAEKKVGDAIKRSGVTVDITRGKPCKEQLDLQNGFFATLSVDAVFGSPDLRNYGDPLGIPAMRQFFAEILGVNAKNVITTGTGSLNVMYDTLQRAFQFGVLGSTPWSKLPKVRFICPAPGYDRHFSMCGHFGMEMLTVPMNADGPDMDVVEQLVAADPLIKGIWCMPKYSNPNGCVYSDEVVDRLARMVTAASDFRIFCDNAYAVHDLTEESVPIKNILDACAAANCPDRVYMFTSTAKIVFPGGACACVAASEKNITDIEGHVKFQAINPNKVAEFLTLNYIKAAGGVPAIMAKHREILKPKFEAVENALSGGLGGLGIASWTKPKGGYFVSLNVYKGTAKKVVKLAKETGLELTAAGATFPYGIDDHDQNIRVAPTFTTTEELETALNILVYCVKIAALEELIKQKSGKVS